MRSRCCSSPAPRSNARAQIIAWPKRPRGIWFARKRRGWRRTACRACRSIAGCCVAGVPTARRNPSARSAVRTRAIFPTRAAGVGVGETTVGIALGWSGVEVEGGTSAAEVGWSDGSSRQPVRRQALARPAAAPRPPANRKNSRRLTALRLAIPRSSPGRITPGRATASPRLRRPAHRRRSRRRRSPRPRLARRARRRPALSIAVGAGLPPVLRSRDAGRPSSS